MTKQPTVSSDSVAQDQIRAFVERILRMKEEAKAIKDDIREIYAEAKGNGFDKTVLGKLVNYVEKRGKDSNAVAEADALFDLYLEAFDGTPSRTRTHAHAREAFVQIAQNVQSVQSVPADTAPAVVAAEGGEGAGAGDLSAEPIQPETANDLTGGENANSAGNADASHSSPDAAVEKEPSRQSHKLEIAGASPAPATISEPDKSGGDAGASSPAPSNITPFTPKPYDDPVSSKGLRRHKLCLNREACAGKWNEPCFTCRKAAEQGGVELQVQGQIG